MTKQEGPPRETGGPVEPAQSPMTPEAFKEFVNLINRIRPKTFRSGDREMPGLSAEARQWVIKR